MTAQIFCGIVWIARLATDGSWFRNLACFPQAVDKNGNPKIDHPLVLEYIKDHS